MPKKPPPTTLGEDWDADKFLRHINSDDHLRTVLGAHLYIESVLGELIEAVVPFPEDLNIRSRRFDERLRWALALGVLHPTEAPAYKALNDLRNELAHGLADYVTKEQTRRVVDSLGDFQRQLMNANLGGRDPAEGDLEAVLVALFVQLKAHAEGLPMAARVNPANTWRAGVTERLAADKPFRFHESDPP